MTTRTDNAIDNPRRFPSIRLVLKFGLVGAVGSSQLGVSKLQTIINKHAYLVKCRRQTQCASHFCANYGIVKPSLSAC